MGHQIAEDKICKRPFLEKDPAGDVLTYNVMQEPKEETIAAG